MSEKLPALVLVGRVNRGKSSILSTLAEDDSIVISPMPGTTTKIQRYPLKVGGRGYFELVDTPGFEDAPRALQVLREIEAGGLNRREAILEFIRRYRDGDKFAEECRLLEPIMEGAAILYVADGSHPFRRNYEAEMEILRWTGQPRIALINRIGARDHSEEWREVLLSFFSIVRSFNAHAAGFDERLRLFEGLREIDDRWRGVFDEAIGALKTDWASRRRLAAESISRMLAACLLHSRSGIVKEAEDAAAVAERLKVAFHDDLRRMERSSRRRIESLYRHDLLNRSELELPEQDLFEKEVWAKLGATPAQLIGLGVVTGGLAGIGFDAITLGAGVLTGAVLGGGAALFHLGNRFESVSDFFKYRKGRKKLVIGPHRNPNFPWILLDRALLHYVAVRDRAHGKRTELNIGGRKSEKQGIAARLPETIKRPLGGTFNRLRKKSGRANRELLQRKLAVELEPLLERLTEEPNGFRFGADNG